MIFEQIQIDGDRNFAYIIGDDESKLGVVIDPAYNQDDILKKIRDHGLTISYIICTHSHYDHVGGNAYMKEKTNAHVVIHQSAGASMGDKFVVDNEELSIGSLTLKFIHTPGHTIDCMCILAENKLITGDTLFVGKIGGTYSRDAAEAQYHSLHDKLMTLPGDIEVYPGHDVGVKPCSTIGYEKTHNPFILQKSFENFFYLKQHWAEYKERHGIK